MKQLRSLWKTLVLVTVLVCALGTTAWATTTDYEVTTTDGGSYEETDDALDHQICWHLYHQYEECGDERKGDCDC